MSDNSDDQNDTCSDNVSEFDSDDMSITSSEGKALITCLKRKVCRPLEIVGRRKFPDMMKEVPPVIEQSSKDKKKGDENTIFIFYSGLKEQKKENQEKKEEVVPDETHPSENTNTQSKPSQGSEPSPPRSSKRVKKCFFC